MAQKMHPTVLYNNAEITRAVPGDIPIFSCKNRAPSVFITVLLYNKSERSLSGFWVISVTDRLTNRHALVHRTLNSTLVK